MLDRGTTLLLSLAGVLVAGTGGSTTPIFPEWNRLGVGGVSPRVTTPAAPERHRGAAPVPIAGGIQIPGGPLIHVFAPGPEALGFQGLQVEPNAITNFKGFAAVAFMKGTAVDRDGRRYDAGYDMRAFQGHYVAADGSRRFGTFAFV